MLGVYAEGTRRWKSEKLPGARGEPWNLAEGYCAAPLGPFDR